MQNHLIFLYLQANDILYKKSSFTQSKKNIGSPNTSIQKTLQKVPTDYKYIRYFYIISFYVQTEQVLPKINVQKEIYVHMNTKLQMR